MVGETGVTRSIIDELLFSYIQGFQMERESGFIRSIIDELHSSDIQGDQREGEGVVFQSIIDELHYLHIERYSLMNFTLLLSKEI